jgi:hypothetical protein
VSDVIELILKKRAYWPAETTRVGKNEIFWYIRIYLEVGLKEI